MSNLEWVYYENLLKEYSENYLMDLLRTGNLQPYDQNGKQIYCPHKYKNIIMYLRYLVTLKIARERLPFTLVQDK